MLGHCLRHEIHSNNINDLRFSRNRVEPLGSPNPHRTELGKTPASRPRRLRRVGVGRVASAVSYGHSPPDRRGGAGLVRSALQADRPGS